MVEGEAFLILAAYLAHRGYFSLPIVIGVAALATFIVTQILFRTGSHYGPAFLAKRPAWQKRIGWVQDKLHRYGAGLVAGFRFLYGLRTVIPIAIGASRYPTGMFVLLNAVGALIWAVITALAGNGIAQVVGVLFADLRKHELAVAVGLAVLAAIWGVVRLYRQPKADPEIQ